MKEALIAALSNPVIIGIIAVILGVVISIIVKKTKTQKDDAVWAMIVNAFNIAEKLVPDNSGPVWLQKADQALKVFNAEYAKRVGKEPTADMLQFAKDQWALLANELKTKNPNS